MRTKCSQVLSRAHRKRVELRNFGIRKDVLQYDDVMNKQREIIYGQRDQVLNGEDLHETILKMVEDTIATSIKQYLPKVLQNIGTSKASRITTQAGL